MIDGNGVKINGETHFIIPEFILECAFTASANETLKVVNTITKKIAEAHLRNMLQTDDYIYFADKEAFSAICNYYAEIISAEDIQKMIEPAILIQRMLSKAKEIIDNPL